MRVAMAASALALSLMSLTPAFGQKSYPVPRPDGRSREEQGEAGPAPPPPIPTDRTPRTLAFPGRPSANRSSADAGRLKGIRAISTSGDEMRIRLAGVEQRVRAGATLEGFVAKSVEPRRLVLLRDDDVAVVTFDAAGNGRVQVYRVQNQGPQPPPEVR